jgi:hypothetical protein
MTAEYGQKQVLFVAVHSDRWETEDDIRAHAAKYGHTFPIIRDPDGHLARLLDARRTPEVFLVDGAGKLRYHGRIAAKIGTPDLRNRPRCASCRSPDRAGRDEGVRLLDHRPD